MLSAAEKKSRVRMLLITSALRPVVDWALSTPLKTQLIVPMARQMMVETAEANGIQWREAVNWIEKLEKWETDDVEVPEYYRAAFHGYERGNLCWEAAFEQEVASAAVGARNYPRGGELAFRGAFESAFDMLGASAEGVVVDLGCGTGTSTRLLAKKHPHATKVVGVDLSPYMIDVARRLGRGVPGTDWVVDVEPDSRVSFECADIARLPFEDGSVDVCQLSLVVHELPPEETRLVLQECARVLKPGTGQLWLCEMDFDTAGFTKLRNNPVLFAFIKSTEPYLDEYAAYNARGIIDDIVSLGTFADVRLRAATGRHFALVATAGHGPPTITDLRQETALPDTHLATFETRATDKDA